MPIKPLMLPSQDPVLWVREYVCMYVQCNHAEKNTQAKHRICEKRLRWL